MAVVPVYLPKFGMTMTHGVIVQWLIEEGAVVSAGAPLAVVETEKVNGEIESPATGTVVELSFEADTEVEVGTVIAYIQEDE
jgi:pyruvate/2-oxoglutarate dehydrogenase complex dihydrolipoamide acyltransferase (E2) component